MTVQRRSGGWRVDRQDMRGDAVSWVHVHVFEGRIYAKRDWRGYWGEAADANPTDSDLGALVLRGLGDPDPAVTSKDVEVNLGLSGTRFRPEKSLHIYNAGDGLMRLHHPHPGSEPYVTVPLDAGAAELGAAIRTEFAKIEPEWPIDRHISIHTEANGRLVIMGFGSWPVPVVHQGIDASELSALIGAALTDCDPEGRPPTAEAYAAAGVAWGDLVGGVDVHIKIDTQNAVTVSGWLHVGPPERLPSQWSGLGDDLLGITQATLDLIRSTPTRHLPPGTPMAEPFGYKCAWLAIRDGRTAQVASALRLTEVSSATWAEGIDAAYEGRLDPEFDCRVFVSPPTSGWTIAAGQPLFEFHRPDVTALSKALGTEVQYFASYRVSEDHDWVLARDGAIIREFHCSGMCGEFTQSGQPTPIEVELGIPDMTSEDYRVNEGTVMKVAGAWSLNPQWLHMTPTSETPGVCGRPPTAPGER
jgi:hypothetical protein